MMGTITLSGIASAALGLLGKLSWNKLRDHSNKVDAIYEELQLQRTNCLTTLQSQGREQIDLLTDINKNIAEQNGFIKGYVEGRR